MSLMRPDPQDGLHLDGATVTAIAASFGLGDAAAAPEAVASGWAAHNVLWRFETDTGTWAVKELGRELAHQVEAAAALEAAAHRAGIPSPQPVATHRGRWLVVQDGRAFRCHRWVEGVCPTTSLRGHDARQAGRALGDLHRLAMPWPEDCIVPPHTFGAAHWRGQADKAASLGLDWSGLLASVIGAILAIEDAALEWATKPHRWVGSHRDVRPDNTLRVGEELLLLDWDAAGPAIPGREVAKALPWWGPHQAEFLAGYTSAAGPVDLEEGAGEDGGLLWWLDTNIRLALDRPSVHMRQEAIISLLQDFKAGILDGQIR